MPHYLIQGSYTAEGCQGLIAEGATVRLEEASSLIAALGGTLESMYYVWGTDDVIGVCEMQMTHRLRRPVWLSRAAGRSEYRLRL